MEGHPRAHVRPRPLRADEPGWTTIDLEFEPEVWRDIYRAARSYRVPSAAYIRWVITLGLEAELRNQTP